MAVIFNSLLLDAIFVLLALFAVLYFYVTRNFNYWENRGVYCIRPTPFFGSVFKILLLRESVGCWLARNYKRTIGEKFFGIYLMDKPTLVVRDLELVKHVFVKDAHVFPDRVFTSTKDFDPLTAKNLFGLKGKKWRNLRAKLSPTFTSSKMKKMFYLVDECGKQLVNCLGQNSSTGTHIHVKETMARYSTDVIASCAFGVNANAQVEPKCEFRRVMKRVFERHRLIDKITAIMVYLLPGLIRLFRLKVIDADIEDLVRKMFWDVVEQRMKTGLVRNDFVDLVIKIKNEGEVLSEDANDLEEINQDNSYNSVEFSNKDNIASEMDDDDYVAQAFVFLIAGFESSSSLLNFTLFELAMNSDIQEKLRNEITTLLDQHNGKLSYEATTEMAYLDMVVSEALRKYPILAFLDRVCSSDYKIPGTEVTIEKGTQVLIPVLGIHHDPGIYPDPEKFDPERFSAENKSKRSQCAHLAYGQGPRICIGMRFGQMQVKTALIYILTSFQVRPCVETPKPPLHYKPGYLAHTPKEDIVLAFRKL